MQFKHASLTLRLFFALIILFSFLPLGFAQGSRPVVRLIYFLPRDHAPQSDIDVKMDRLIKDVQRTYAGIMEGHGFGRKTFRLETDASGNAVVHHIKGRFTDEHYSNLPRTWDIWGEINEQFDTSKNIYLTAIDISTGVLDSVAPVCGLGGAWGGAAGKTLIPASGHCFNINAIAHELGHAFGLQHDIRGDVKRILSDTSDWMVTSFCAAEWLDAHRAFNADQPVFNERPTIEMLPARLASPPNVIHLQFKVTDFDGLHQVQLLTPGDDGFDSLLGCKRLNDSSNSTVEFVTPRLTPKSKSVSLQMIDVRGNLSSSKSYLIDVPSLLPRPEVVSIPDANLAAAAREKIGNSLTTHTLLNLTSLDVPNRGITALTGLEHAHNLTRLNLGGEYIHRGYVNSNKVSNFSPLLGLAQLTTLNLSFNSLSDVSSLSGLTQLTWLSLDNNTITDVSPLAGLTQLAILSLRDNTIVDVSSLVGLTQLISLRLDRNTISNVAPLAGLTQLTWLNLSSNNISDVSALAELTQLIVLDLRYNTIADIAPLVELNLTSTLWNITGLYLESNPLSYASINTHIPAMQAKGIEVKFNNRTPTTLVEISGAAQQGIVNAALALPFVVEVRDQHNRAFAGVPVTFAVTTGGGSLSATPTTTDATGRAQAHLTLGRTAGTTTVRVTAANISQPVEFTATAAPLSSRVTVSDANLRGKIVETLGKPRGRTLTAADMLRLTTLTANNANIRELTGLQHASNLRTLSLDGNNILDVVPLTALTQLTRLSLNSNNISDVALLGALTQLKTLSLDDNSIWDIAPLEALAQLKTLHLKGNLLSYPSLHTSVPTLQASGATVTFDARTPTTLVKLSGAHGVAGTALPVVVEVQDEKGFGFVGVLVTFTVTAGGGHLSAPNIITGNTGRAQTILTLGTTPGKNIVRAAAAEVSRPISFTINAIDASSHVGISDTNLRRKIADTLGKPRGVQLTAGDMLALTRLEVPNANIRDLTGIEHAHNLTGLTLWNNAITDVAPLASLTQLTSLRLNDNTISDVSALAGLAQLKSLSLAGNAIVDASPLVGLTQLTSLALYNNDISDVSDLAGLTQLTSLYLGSNSIFDVSPLSGLIQLTYLDIQGNVISDVSPLIPLNLTGTQWDSTGLHLERNPLSYASINTHIPAMQAKGIEVKFNNRAYPALLKISGDGQEGLAGHTLSAPFIVEVQDERGRPMPDVAVTFAMDTGGGLLNPTTTKTDADGKARTTLILGWTPGTTTLRATARGMKSYLRFTATATVLADRVAEDVNGDGVIDVEDLMLVASSLGVTPIPGAMPATDVNGDGVINNEDVLLVLAALEGTPAAPSLDTQWTVESLQQWIAEAKRRSSGDDTFQRGIAVLERLLAHLLPKETTLLPNYPNPFNPETWIPYQLAEPADVTLHIYSVNGALVRTLELGHQIAGVYHNKSRAAYWDGRNEQGERVASGVYFYTLSVGDFTATRKMLIRK